MSEKPYIMSILFDYYGELLTEKQKRYFDLYYNDDLSLAEIAENEGISRQGVRDMIVRAENTLREIEEKTGSVKRIRELESGLDNIVRLLEDSISEDGTVEKSAVCRVKDYIDKLKG